MVDVAEKKSSFKRTIQDESKTEKLGDLLRKDGIVTRSQLNEAAEIQKKTNARIGKILIELGYIDEETLVNFLSRQMKINVVNPMEVAVPENVVKLVAYETAKQHMVLPFSLEGEVLTLAMVDPTNMKAVEEIQMLTKLSIKSAISNEKNLVDGYKKYYGISDEEYQGFFRSAKEEKKEEDTGGASLDSLGNLGDIISDAAEQVEVGEETGIDESDQLYNSGDAAIIKLMNGILLKAINQGVSDIHIEPYEKTFQVRYRQDGTLHKAMNLPLQIKNALLSRVKIMSNLNIAEKRKPQDGRIKLKLSRTRAVDFRVSVLPTLFGESAVLRILDPSKLKVDLAALGLSEANLKQYLKALHAPQGLCLVTGPTGSGKTNTLYSGIAVLNKPEVKILTAEDPVEFNFPGINQVHVDAQAGLTFAGTLRAFLRQDPEVILVGEIRDLETAEIAVKAAMTGHMVLSTLHTNDCPSTVGRLLDIGIPGFMLSSCLVLILAQRLGKKICSQCKEPLTKISAAKLIEAGFQKEEFPTLKLYKGKGCPVCNSTGNKGRIGIFEIMECTESVKKAISAQLPEDQLRKIATKDGMLSLRMDALQKAREGMISLDEVLSKTVSHTDSLPAYLLTPDEKVFQDGDLIIKEGNTDKNFYQLMQGSVVITKGGRVIGEISQPGDYFGEMSALLDQPRVATIKSKGKSVVKVFPGDKLKETLINYPDISLKIIRSLINRLNETDRRLSRMVEQQQQQ